MPAARVKMRIESADVARLVSKLVAIDKKAARKAIREGINEVTKRVMWSAKKNVPKRTGQLRKSLGRKIKVYRGGAVITGIIGPRKGYRVVLNGVPIDPVKYAHLVEYGRREVVPTKKKVLAGSGVPLTKKQMKAAGPGPYVKIIYGTKVRSVPPVRFMERAWEEHAAAAPGLIEQRLRIALMKFLLAGRSRRSR